MSVTNWEVLNIGVRSYPAGVKSQQCVCPCLVLESNVLFYFLIQPTGFCANAGQERREGYVR